MSRTGRNERTQAPHMLLVGLYTGTAIPESSLAVLRQIKCLCISSTILFQSMSVAKEELRAAKLSTITRKLKVKYKNAIIDKQCGKKKSNVDLNSMKWKRG